MFNWFSRLLLKGLIILVVGVVIICVATVLGCTPNTGTELSQSQGALAVKNNLDSSQEDNRQDNSIEFVLSDIPYIDDLPPQESNADDMVKMVNARAEERALVIRAEAELKEMVIRAEEEKWRLLVWVIGIGAAVITALALFVKPPFQSKGKYE